MNLQMMVAITKQPCNCIYNIQSLLYGSPILNDTLRSESRGSHAGWRTWVRSFWWWCVEWSELMLHDMDTFRSWHDDVIKWKHFPRYWPFLWGIHRSPHKGQWHGALMFSLICAWINGWVNNREAGDLRRHRAHYDVIVMDITVLNSLSMKNLVTTLGERNPLDIVLGDTFSLRAQPLASQQDVITHWTKWNRLFFNVDLIYRDPRSYQNLTPINDMHLVDLDFTWLILVTSK